MSTRRHLYQAGSARVAGSLALGVRPRSAAWVTIVGVSAPGMEVGPSPAAVMGPRRGWRDSRVLAAVGMAVILALVVIQAPRLLAEPGNPQYTVLDYGPMDDQGSVLRHINGLREIAGGFRRPGPGKVAGAVVGGQQSQQEIRAGLGSGGELSIAYGINDRGDVAGSFTAATPGCGRSGRTAAMQCASCHSCLGDTGGIAYAINGGGEAVGYSSGASGQRAVWWDGSGAVRALPGSTGEPAEPWA